MVTSRFFFEELLGSESGGQYSNSYDWQVNKSAKFKFIAFGYKDAKRIVNIKANLRNAVQTYSKRSNIVCQYYLSRVSSSFLQEQT